MNQTANNLDVVYGEYTDLTQVREFVSGVKDSNCSGTLYIGYPVLSIDDGKIEFDALLVSPSKGVIIFDLYSAGELADYTPAMISTASTGRQEQLYAALFNRLNSFKELRKGRSLVVDISTVTINPLADDIKTEDDFNEISIDLLGDFYESIDESALTPEQEQHLNAAIQRISNLKPQKKRLNITRADSRGAVIKRIEEQIANLDLWQKRGSIEYVNGPQRIRGLAGSGKTVVLALKAAYLHVKRPDWDIAITFNSRALYQQFESLLTRFVYSQVNDEPDWTKLHIMHSWGDSSKPGIYSRIVHEIGSPYRDFSSASRKWTYATAFTGACQEALDALGDRELDLFDMVLIDEAQDLPSPFFKLVYQITKDPKRIIWAYDDLQNLGDTQLPSPKDLFGVDKKGDALVTLKNKEDYPQEDIVLPRCYRTPPESLVVAHGLGFGIYREPVVQMFPQPKIWERLGYKVKDGSLEFGEDVDLIRDPESVPEFFARLLKQDEIIQFKKFSDTSEQYNWVAFEINRLIAEEDLQCSDF
jgi:superfamily I DNA and RNA helicase